MGTQRRKANETKKTHPTFSPQPQFWFDETLALDRDGKIENSYVQYLGRKKLYQQPE